MKEQQGLRIFACFAVLLMILSIFPAGALAASDNGKNSGNGGNSGSSQSSSGSNSAGGSDSSGGNTGSAGDQQHDRDMTNAPDTAQGTVLNKITDKVQQIKNAREGFRTARSNFISIRSNNPNLDTEEAIEATREYLISSIDYMTSVLDNEEYIAELEKERENVEAATGRDELADSAKNIRSTWQDARRDRITSAGKTIDGKISNVIETSESLMVRLESEISTMKENGEDVEDLETMLEEYKELIADAKENQEQARNTYMNGNGTNVENVREANRYIVQSGKDVKDANAILRNMLKELKQQREGLVTLSGEGTLEAEGNGTVVISGDVVMDITVTDAKLVIKDLAGDASIIMDNADYETSNIDAGNSTDDNRAFVYLNTTGEIHIEGSRLTVMVRGEDIKLEAEGTGNAVLAGTGTYDAEGTSGDWANHYMEDGGELEVNSENGENSSTVTNSSAEENTA